MSVFPTKLKFVRFGWVWEMVQLTGPVAQAANDVAW